MTLLGFAQRAGKAASGESASVANLKKGKARLVILAEDASERTRSSFSRLCDDSGVPCRVFSTKQELGLALGRTPRSIVTILDSNFGKSILKELSGE